MNAHAITTHQTFGTPQSSRAILANLTGVNAMARGVLGMLADFMMEDEANNLSMPDNANYDSRDCVLVIDASGSMEATDWKPSRLKAAKEAAKTYCERLSTEEPNAQVAIVGYGSCAKVFCPLTRAADTGTLNRAITRIDGLGGTNIRAGLQETSAILKHSKNDCQVILLTDGHNTGRSPKSVAATLKKNATIECVGIGGSPHDVDEKLLRWIASESTDGSKRYRWIGDKERLVKHFHKLAGRISRS